VHRLDSINLTCTYRFQANNSVKYKKTSTSNEEEDLQTTSWDFDTWHF